MKTGRLAPKNEHDKHRFLYLMADRGAEHRWALQTNDGVVSVVVISGVWDTSWREHTAAQESGSQPGAAVNRLAGCINAMMKADGPSLMFCSNSVVADKPCFRNSALYDAQRLAADSSILSSLDQHDVRSEERGPLVIGTRGRLLIRIQLGSFKKRIQRRSDWFSTPRSHSREPMADSG